MAPASYAAAIVTFRRAVSLRQVLEGLARQSHRPELVVVADNDPERSAERVVAEIAAQGELRVQYLAVGENLGPAGGWARAVELARRRSDRGSWIAIFDDDDPIVHPDLMERLAARAASADPEVAAIGMRGAVLHHRLATLERIPRTSPDGSADYLASGGAPLYRWSVVDGVGFFDERLFFGFEDLDLGLRLRAHRFRLVVEPQDALHVVQDTAPRRTAWREYYKTRALVVICRRHLGPLALVATLVRAVLVGSVLLAVRDRQAALMIARWRGARDGVRGRLGPGAYVPEVNPPK
jgi:GT2 family glycosyltransferase